MKQPWIWVNVKTWIHKEWMTAKKNDNQNVSIRNGMYTIRGLNWVTMEIKWLIKDFIYIVVFLVYIYFVQRAIKIPALQCIWSSSDNVSNNSGQCTVYSAEWVSQRQRNAGICWSPVLPGSSHLTGNQPIGVNSPGAQDISRDRVGHFE